jgi:hypothetical protein
MRKKSTNIWITMLWLPFVSLILIALLQMVAQFVFGTVEGSSSSAAIPVILNIISLLVGIFAIIAILLFPLWIVMLIRASNYNKSIAKQTEQQPTDTNNHKN